MSAICHFNFPINLMFVVSISNSIFFHTDMKDILSDLREHKHEAFNHLYSGHFPVVQRFILNNNGNEADAEDAFQETLMVLMKKLERDDFELTASLKTYLVAISKNLWFKKLRNRQFELQVDDLLNEPFNQEIELAIEEEKTYMDRLKGYMNNISAHCNRLINDMFFKGKSIEEVQTDYGYSSRHNAINQKHKCINQIRKVKEADIKAA